MEEDPPAWENRGDIEKDPPPLWNNSTVMEDEPEALAAKRKISHSRSEYNEDLLPTLSLPSLQSTDSTSTVRWRCGLASMAVLATVLLMLLSYLYLEGRGDEELPTHDNVINVVDNRVTSSGKISNDMEDGDWSVSSTPTPCETHLVIPVPNLNSSDVIDTFRTFTRSLLDLNPFNLTLHLVGNAGDLNSSQDLIARESNYSVNMERIEITDLIKGATSYLGARLQNEVQSLDSLPTLVPRLLPLFLHTVVNVSSAAVLMNWSLPLGQDMLSKINQTFQELAASSASLGQDLLEEPTAPSPGKVIPIFGLFYSPPSTCRPVRRLRHHGRLLVCLSPDVIFLLNGSALREHDVSVLRFLLVDNLELLLEDESQGYEESLRRTLAIIKTEFSNLVRLEGCTKIDQGSLVLEPHVERCLPMTSVTSNVTSV